MTRRRRCRTSSRRSPAALVENDALEHFCPEEPNRRADGTRHLFSGAGSATRYWGKAGRFGLIEPFPEQFEVYPREAVILYKGSEAPGTRGVLSAKNLGDVGLRDFEQHRARQPMLMKHVPIRNSEVLTIRTMIITLDGIKTVQVLGDIEQAQDVILEGQRQHLASLREVRLQHPGDVATTDQSRAAEQVPEVRPASPGVRSENRRRNPRIGLGRAVQREAVQIVRQLAVDRQQTEVRQVEVDAVDPLHDCQRVM